MLKRNDHAFNKITVILLVAIIFAVGVVIWYIAKPEKNTNEVINSSANKTILPTNNANTNAKTNTNATNENYTVSLKSRSFIPEANINGFFQNLNQKKLVKNELLAGKYHVVIQFYNIPTEAEKSKINELGITLHDYLPKNAYTASINIDLAADDVNQLGLIRSLFTLERNDKLSEDIQKGEIGSWAIKESGKVDVVVKYYPDVPNDKAQTAIQTLEGKIIESAKDFYRLTVRIDQDKLQALADNEWISWIEPIAPPPATSANVE